MGNKCCNAGGEEIPEVIHGKSFIIDNRGRINNFYTINRKSKLGQGTFGKVQKATCKKSGSVRAIKTINKSVTQFYPEFRQEMRIMKEMDHPYIVKLYETFEDAKNIYLVLELCNGGELFDRLIDASNSFTEKEAAHLMRQALKAVNYMHTLGVCHRDIKPENFLFSNQGSILESTLKLIDFGFACHIEPGEYLSLQCGTTDYLSPEVIKERYNQSIDIWGCGVLMFEILSGRAPFKSTTQKETISRICKAAITFEGKEWSTVSQDAKELILMLLQKDPEDRYTADQALSHVWIKDLAPHAVGNFDASLFNNLRAFRAHTRLKKAALHMMAAQLEEKHILGLRDTFMHLDENGDGMLTFQEFADGLARALAEETGVEVPNDLKDIMKSMDSDESGKIDHTEFLAAALDKKVYLQENICWAAFRVFDRNGDGRISKEELKVVLQEASVGEAMHCDAQMIKEIMKEADTNGDGIIDFEEFMKIMRGEQPDSPKILPNGSPF